MNRIAKVAPIDENIEYRIMVDNWIDGSISPPDDKERVFACYQDGKWLWAPIPEIPDMVRYAERTKQVMENLIADGRKIA